MDAPVTNNIELTVDRIALTIATISNAPTSGGNTSNAITEQIEEERIFDEVIQTLKLAGDNRAALLLLDRQLGARQLDQEANAAEPA